MRFGKIKKVNDFILFILLLLLFKIFMYIMSHFVALHTIDVIFTKSMAWKPKLKLLAAKIISKIAFTNFSGVTYMCFY